MAALVIRKVLRAALVPAVAADSIGFGDAMRALFEPLGGVDIAEIERGPRDFEGCGTPLVNPWLVGTTPGE
jgi:hypothetical protein